MNKMIIAAAVAVAMAGSVKAEGTAFGTLLSSADGAAGAVPAVQAAVPAEKGFFQNWGGNGASDGFFGRWDKAAGGEKAVGDTQVYRNDGGCEAMVEERRNGSLIYVREADGTQAWLWLGKDLRSGEITSFCSPAAVSAQGGSVRLSCGEHANGGFYTRGEAVLDLTGGLSAVSVRGDVKRAFGWKTDTSISCGGLKPAGGRAAEGLSGSYRRNDGYTSSTLNVRETAQDGVRKLEFELVSVTGSGNTGDISGVAVQAANGGFVYRGAGGCRLSFAQNAQSLSVSGGDESCADMMGLNVTVDGEYLRK